MRKTLLVLAGTLAVSALAVPVAQAAAPKPAPVTYASCNYGAYTQIFYPWGDHSYYDAIPTGSFETGDAPGWTLTGGASVTTPGNTLVPYTRGYALSMPVGSSVTTPPICVETGLPYIRMFGYTTTIPTKVTSGLQVQLLYTSTAGKDVTQNLTTINNLKAWAPTPQIKLPSADSIKPDSNNHLWVQYRFTPLNKTAWSIDDLFVDPKKH